MSSPICAFSLSDQTQMLISELHPLFSGKNETSHSTCLLLCMKEKTSDSMIISILWDMWVAISHHISSSYFTPLAKHEQPLNRSSLRCRLTFVAAAETSVRSGGGGCRGQEGEACPPQPPGLLNYLNEQRRPIWGSQSFEVYKSFWLLWGLGDV